MPPKLTLKSHPAIWHQNHTSPLTTSAVIPYGPENFSASDLSNYNRSDRSATMCFRKKRSCCKTNRCAVQLL